MNGSLHVFGHTHLQVLKLRIFGREHLIFLGHLHWQLDGSTSKGDLHVLSGHSQSQDVSLKYRGGKQSSGLQSGLH